VLRNEDIVSGSLVADLGIGPKIWVFLSMLGCLTIFFKFSRFWSVRNLDLVLLFSLAPGLMRLVGSSAHPWSAYVWLFLGSTLWLVRCLIDLGMARRPILEPNLNMAGLTCLSIGIMALLLAETVSLPISEGAARNPAEHSGRDDPPPTGTHTVGSTVNHVLRLAHLPPPQRPNPPQVIFKRVLAFLSHLGLVTGLIAVGWRHFERPIAGLAVATCYLLLPYTRIAVVDLGQLLPAALIVGALVFYTRPFVSGPLIGLAAGWMPACLGLLPLWAGFYSGRGARRFLGVSMALVLGCGLLAWAVPGLPVWARALGARSLAEAGLLPNVEAPSAGSFWAGIDASYRLPVLILYLALVVVTSLWPAEKNLGELIALSAALLVASQLWYLDEGGTIVLLYLPLVLLMIFRPNLSAKRPFPTVLKIRETTHSLNSIP
jgi:hypothetical protein